MFGASALRVTANKTEKDPPPPPACFTSLGTSGGTNETCAALDTLNPKAFTEALRAAKLLRGRFQPGQHHFVICEGRLPRLFLGFRVARKKQGVMRL